MDCQLAESLLGDYLDNELNEELRDRVAKHLIKCQRCAWEVQSLRETLAALRASTFPAEPTTELRERVLRHLLRDHRVAVAVEPGSLVRARQVRPSFVLDLSYKEKSNAPEECN